MLRNKIESQHEGKRYFLFLIPINSEKYDFCNQVSVLSIKRVGFKTNICNESCKFECKILLSHD